MSAVEAATALIASVPYASLVGWDGRVAYGLRFTTETVRRASSAPSDSVTAPWLNSGVSPAHPVAGAAVPMEAEPPSDAVPADALRSGADQAAAAGARVLLLAPGPFVVGLAHGELAVRLNLCGWAAGTRRWISVALGGWTSLLSDADRRAAAVHFAQRHPTDDLLDLGSRWSLVQMDVGEALLRTNRECLQLGRAGAIGLLVSAGPR
ncbi:hypothetical protein [Frankia sp. AiPa1]|uniref:hypothetical protein n=1 Tax=Frankia sp. AiPa1 TaxID=573492 RepID=UPI00202B7407|nr:hypothetical protein [Frankia sp. AiPa1]